MAIRRSGQVVVRLAWIDTVESTGPHGGHYKCSVKTPDGVQQVIVNAAAHITDAVDSSESYDSAASAAIAFADAGEYADYDAELSAIQFERG